MRKTLGAPLAIHPLNWLAVAGSARRADSVIEADVLVCAYCGPLARGSAGGQKRGLPHGRFPQHFAQPVFIMSVKVRIPTPLRKLTHEQELVEVPAGTIGSAIAELQRQFPGIQERLVDEAGNVRRFVNVYVNEEDIRFLQNNDTPVKDGDEVSIIPAIAGG